MNVTRFQRLRQILSSHRALDKIRIHLREFHSDVLFSWFTAVVGKPFPPDRKSAMVIAPHQDDETFGCGGMMALKCHQGVAVRIVFLTDGAHAPLPRDGSVATGELVNTRIAEALAAARALGIPEGSVQFLGLPDNTLRGMAEPQRSAAIERLRSLLEQHRPEEIYVTHCRDGHGDHEVAYELTVAAIRQSQGSFRLLQYMIWRPWLEPILTWSCLRDLCTALRLPIDAVIERKRQAIAAYSSQVATLPTGFLTRFYRPHELFFPVK
jgi:N-acetylglucosamine malate deacetylase 1